MSPTEIATSLFTAAWSILPTFILGLAGIYLMIAIIAFLYKNHYKVGTMVHSKVGTGGPFPTDLWHVSGDTGSEMIHDEMFMKDGKHAYIKYTVKLPSEVEAVDKYQRSKKEAVIPALVVDVGANVGLFAMSMAKLTNTGKYAKIPGTQKPVENGGPVPRIQVVGFEPIPDTFECSTRNYEATFGKSNSQYPQYASNVYQMGVGDKSESVKFTYDPTFSGGAFTSADASQLWGHGFAQPVRMLSAFQHDMAQYQPFPLNYLQLLVAYGMAIPLLKYLIFLFVGVPWLFGSIVWRLVSKNPSKETEAQIEPLPKALERAGLGSDKKSNPEFYDRPIAFLKIDVEGAEERVVNGIDAATWDRVQQVVVETHETPDGRVDRIVQKLKDNGFEQIAVDVEPLWIHQVLKIKSIFATKN